MNSPALGSFARGSASSPNILFLMSDQHNARCLGCAGHPNVKTPNLDRVATHGVRFTHAYCNNPVCSPSRVSIMTGQYPHTHRILGNENFDLDDRNPNTLGAVFRRHGHQTAMIGKAHLIKRWDDEAFEHIRYCDLCDADRNDPASNHYFKYLIDHGLADLYEDGALPQDHEARRKGCAIAQLPYEHSVERWTGDQALAFLETRDRDRPFFLFMTFERPHPNWMPSVEHANLYDPDAIQFNPDLADWWEHRWAGRPEFLRKLVADWMRDRTLADLRRMLAYHFALVTVIDMEIGRILDWLEHNDQARNTVIIYGSDHGDFAGDHGICDKNIGIYESIHRIPFLLSYPGGPMNVTRDAIIEWVDLFPTLCELAQISPPDNLDGRSILLEAEGLRHGKAQAIAEWSFLAPQQRVNAIRTDRYRLVFYSHDLGGELYDHATDPYETRNLWDDPSARGIRLELLERLFDQIKWYSLKSSFEMDAIKFERDQHKLTTRIHKRGQKWSELIR